MAVVMCQVFGVRIIGNLSLLELMVRMFLAHSVRIVVASIPVSPLRPNSEYESLWTALSYSVRHPTPVTLPSASKVAASWPSRTPRPIAVHMR